MRLVRDYDPAMDPPALAHRRGLRALVRPGSHDAEILRLAIPAFGALVAEPLFLLGDSAIVGRIGTIPLGGLGVASQALSTLVNISIFLAYGTTAAVARQLGAGNRPAAIGHGIDGGGLAARPAHRPRVRRDPGRHRRGGHVPADQPVRRAGHARRAGRDRRAAR